MCYTHCLFVNVIILVVANDLLIAGLVTNGVLALQTLQCYGQSRNK